MALTGEEIRHRLSVFAAKWSVYDGAWTDLKAVHRKLDDAVAVTYGWPARIAQDTDETKARLLEFNYAITDNSVTYAPFTTRATDGDD